MSPLVPHWSYQFLLRIPRSDQCGAGVAFHLARSIQDIRPVGVLVVIVGPTAPDTLLFSFPRYYFPAITLMECVRMARFTM